MTFQVVQQPAPDGSPLTGGTISYLSRHVPVIELARRLSLPPVTPLARTRILITGSPEQPFGVAIDTIASTQLAAVADIKPIPAWITQSRMGRFIWGVVAVDVEALLATSPTPKRSARP